MRHNADKHSCCTWDISLQSFLAKCLQLDKYFSVEIFARILDDNNRYSFLYHTNKNSIANVNLDQEEFFGSCGF